MRNRLYVGALGAVSLLLVLVVSTPGSPITVLPESPVADAAMRSDTETVRALLREGADVNAAQGDGMTALHWTALNGDVATMQVVLYAGANLEPTTRLGAYTPLHLASREGRSEAVVMLLEARSHAGRFTDTGVTALHLAAQAGASEAIVALLEHGAEVDVRDTHSERTPLIFATAGSRLDAMRTLIAAGADVSAETKLIDFPERNRFDTAEQRTRQRVVDAAKPPQPRGGRATAARRPLAAAAGAPLRGNQTPPDPDDPPDRGGRAAQTPPDPDDPPARGGQAQTTPPDPDDPPARGGRGAGQTPPDPDDPPPAVGATRTAGLDPGAEPSGATAALDPNVPRSLSNTDQIGVQGGFTALHYAARDGRYDAAMLLLEAGADMNHRTGGDESSPMLVAVINGNFDLAMTLLERGADPNLVSEDGAGPLFAVLNNEWQLRTWYPQPTASQQQETSYLEIMRALLDAGADPDQRTNSHIWYSAYNAGRMGVDFSGATAFWRAAYATDVTAMQLLIEYGADPNIPTMKLASSRNRRSFGGRSGGGSDDEEDPSGRPPVAPGGPHVHALHAATGVGFGTSRVGQQHRHVPDGWLPAVQYLVGELGVDVNVIDADGYSAVHNAAARGDNPVIEYLVEHGAEVTFVSRRGQTTVDMANGPQQRVQPFPDTIALLESLGAINNNNCISCD
jgi:ankyrin repeat protein